MSVELREKRFRYKGTRVRCRDAESARRAVRFAAGCARGVPEAAEAVALAEAWLRGEDVAVGLEAARRRAEEEACAAGPLGPDMVGERAARWSVVALLGAVAEAAGVAGASGWCEVACRSLLCAGLARRSGPEGLTVEALEAQERLFELCFGAAPPLH